VRSGGVEEEEARDGVDQCSCSDSARGGGDFRSTHTLPAFGEERVERERE
jgi:hypothetical protein